MSYTNWDKFILSLTNQKLHQRLIMMKSPRKKPFYYLSSCIILYLLPQYQSLTGDSANAVPHNINYASEFPTFGEIAEVNSTGVQWSSLALGEPPWWSWLTPMPGKYAVSVEYRAGSLQRQPTSYWYYKLYI